MKEIIDELKHKVKINRELEEEYREDWVQAVMNRDEVKRDCSNDLLTLTAGQIMAYEEVIKMLEEKN